MGKQEKKEKVEKVIQKYGIDIKELEKEQEKLAKQIELKDSLDFSNIVKIGGISNVFFQNKIISAIVVLNPEFELIEQKYFSDKVKFPYIPGFRAYRELTAMTSCFSLLDEKPEIIFVPGHGTAHPRLGLASHFSLVTGIPTVGIADSLFVGEVKKGEVGYKGRKVAKILETKKGSRPLYISPGNMISLDTAVELTKKYTKELHKLPEPLMKAHKYAREVMKELFKKDKK